MRGKLTQRIFQFAIADNDLTCVEPFWRLRNIRRCEQRVFTACWIWLWLSAWKLSLSLMNACHQWPRLLFSPIAQQLIFVFHFNWKSIQWFRHTLSTSSALTLESAASWRIIWLHFKISGNNNNRTEWEMKTMWNAQNTTKVAIISLTSFTVMKCWLFHSESGIQCFCRFGVISFVSDNYLGRLMHCGHVIQSRWQRIEPIPTEPNCLFTIV